MFFLSPGLALNRSSSTILIVPKKSIKVNDKYVDKIDIRNPCIGTDISNNGDKWDLMLII